MGVSSLPDVFSGSSLNLELANQLVKIYLWSVKKSKKDVIRDFLAEAGRKGGSSTAEKHGSKAMAKWGKRGGKARAAKYDAATLSAWAKKGGRPPKAGA
jgi:hypothetical protein